MSRKHYAKMYKGINLDPARICMIYDITNLVQGGIVKKALAAGNRGHKNVLEDIEDIKVACDRWIEMILEDLDEA